MGVTATWGSDESEVVETVEQLDTLLDRVEADARRSGCPQNVELDAGEAGTLGLVVGADRGLLNHVPADSNPPYLTSVGDEDDERAFVFFVHGDHYTEGDWRHTIPTPAAREAARVFLLDAVLDARVRWDEI